MFFKKNEIKKNFSTHFFREDLKLFFLYNLPKNIISVKLPDIKEYSNKTFELFVKNEDLLLNELIKVYKNKIPFTFSIWFNDLLTFEYKNCFINSINFPIIEKENKDYYINIVVDFNIENLILNNLSNEMINIYGGVE